MILLPSTLFALIALRSGPMTYQELCDNVQLSMSNAWRVVAKLNSFKMTETIRANKEVRIHITDKGLDSLTMISALTRPSGEPA